MKSSEQINELATALAKAQAKMNHALKDKVNPHFKSRYADLAANIDAVKGPLNENGISVLQLPMEAENGVTVETCLLHSSGQWISSVTSVPVSKQDAQGYGSALTYARRYGLAAMCGIGADDDDGNAAAAAPPQKKSTSVNRLALEDDIANGAQVNWGHVDAVIHNLRHCLSSEDEVGVYELVEGLDNLHKMAVWTKLETPEKTAARKIVDKYRAADGKPNPGTPVTRKEARSAHEVQSAS